MASLACLASCEFVQSFIHDDDVVATVGNHKLYRSEVTAVIPSGLSSEDSLKTASQFIRNWASDLVFLDIAEEQLSKSEKDVTAEMEDYRKALLKYRYEQLFIDQRLDTEVPDDEVEEYYETHKDNFVLRVPAVKARFIRISADSPNLETISKKLSSQDEDDIALLDSLAYVSADRYTDFGGGWTDMVTLSREFGEDYGSLISKIQNSRIVQEDEYGKLNIACILQYIKAGAVAPLEYSADEIKDVIINARKKAIVSTLEQDLLEEAIQKHQFKIYQ